MTTRWRPEFDPDDLYFVTTTAAKRRRIFQTEAVKRILVDGLYYVSLMNKVELYGFVVMPNHIHVMIQCPPDCPPARWVRAYKTSTSQLIVRLHLVQQNRSALASLKALVTRPEKQQYKIWEDGYMAKSVITPEFCAEKIDYIHNNPVQEQWRLADSPEEYPWSSARYYVGGEPCVIPVKDVRELLG